MKGFRTAPDNSRTMGFAGPPSAKATEVYSKYAHRGHVARASRALSGRGRQVGGRRAQEDLRVSVKKPIAGGTNGAAVVALPHPGTQRTRRLTRFLESERLLASLLLAPTVLLLGTFIAYPFVSGVWLSLSDTSVGNVGHFVGLKNFAKAWDDSIFQQAFRNTFFYTFWATIFKLALGMWLAPAAQPQLPRQASRARLDAAAVHHPDRALDVRLAVDVRSDVQRAELAPLSGRASS